jgi:hypothetical protein
LENRFVTIQAFHSTDLPESSKNDIHSKVFLDTVFGKKLKNLFQPQGFPDCALLFTRLLSTALFNSFHRRMRG